MWYDWLIGAEVVSWVVGWKTADLVGILLRLKDGRIIEVRPEDGLDRLVLIEWEKRVKEMSGTTEFFELYAPFMQYVERLEESEDEDVKKVAKFLRKLFEKLEVLDKYIAADLGKEKVDWDFFNRLWLEALVDESKLTLEDAIKLAEKVGKDEP